MHVVAARGERPAPRPRRAAVVRATTRAGTVLVALCGLLVGAASGALGQEADPGDGPRIVVTSMDAVLGPGSVDAADDEVPVGATAGPLRLSVLVDNATPLPLDAASLVVEVHDPVTTRSALRTALEGTGPEDVGKVVLDAELPTLPAGQVAQQPVEVTAEDGGWGASSGITVHPVVISVLRGSDLVDQVRTAVVWVGTTPATRLVTTAVLPVGAPPGRSPSTVGLGTAVRPGGVLDRLVRTGEATPAGTFAVAPDAAVLEDLAGAAEGGVDGAEALRDRLVALVAAQPDGPVTQPYAAADLAALSSSTGTADLAALAVAEGRLRLRTQTGRAPANVQLATAPLTPAALDLVPTDVLVTRWGPGAGSDLDGEPPPELPSPVRAARTPSGRSTTVLVGDPWATEALADDGQHGWALPAHRVVLATAVSQLEAVATGAPEDAAMVLVPPDGWEAPGDLGPMLGRALASASWLEVVDPGTLAARFGRGDLAAWTPVPLEEAEPSRLVDRLAVARRRLGGLAAATGAAVDGTTTAESGEAVLDLRRATDALLRATSTWPRDDQEAEALARVAAVRAAVDDALGSVEVPGDAAVTLTSERGAVPVTVQHPNGTRLQVLVDVTARGALNFDGGTTRAVELPPGGNATVAFDATALGRGTFPVLVVVSTPDGDVELARSVLSVRSTAVSQPALLAVGGTVVVLLLLGGRRRSRRSPTLAVVPDAPDPS